MNAMSHNLTHPLLAPIKRPWHTDAQQHENDPSIGLTPRTLMELLYDAEKGNQEAYLHLAERIEEKDPHYLSVLGTRKRQVSQLEISVEAAGSDEESRLDADLVRNVLDRIDTQGLLFHMLDAVGKGFSCMEILWSVDASRWAPAAFHPVDPCLIVFPEKTPHTPHIKKNRKDKAPEPLTSMRFMPFFLSAKSGIPIRGGLARAAAWCFLYKTQNMRGWAEFLEIYGQPMRLGKYHMGATEDEKATLLRAVASVGRDAAAIIPESMRIDFIKSSQAGSNSDLYKDMAQYIDQQISKLVLGQTATTDAISGGHAIGKEHNLVRGDIARSDARALARALEEYLMIPLIRLNHGIRENYPKIRLHPPMEDDLESLARSLKALVPLGLKVSQDSVRARFGFKEPSHEEDKLGKA